MSRALRALRVLRLMATPLCPARAFARSARCAGSVQRAACSVQVRFAIVMLTE